MPFTPKVWKDLPDTTTPVSASSMNDLETRLSNHTEASVVNEAANIRDTRWAGGAVGNGSTDDRAAILAACTAAIGAPRGRVFVPDGVYRLSSGIALTADSFTMDGQSGRRAIFEMLAASNTDIFSVTPSVTGGESNSGRITGMKFRTTQNGSLGNGKAGLALLGMRHFHVANCDFDALDIGMDMRANCFGTKLDKLTSVGARCRIGIILRGATPLTGGGVAGSGSDITMTDCWVGGRTSAVWMEPNAGGYHFITGQLKGGIEVGSQQDDYGSVTMGRGYDILSTTTANVNPGDTILPVAAAASTNFFSSGQLVVGANHRVNYTTRDTAGSRLTGVTGITTFVPSGTPIYLRGTASVIDFWGSSWEGSSHRHAIRAYGAMNGLTLDGCSINSNGANRLMNIIKGTDCQLSVISFRRLGVQGTFTATVPLDLQNLAGSWDIQEEQPNVHFPATFNGVALNFQTKPMTEWSGINARVRASFGDNSRWQGRTLRWTGSTLESHTDSSATTGWLPVSTGGSTPVADPGTFALGGSDQEERTATTPFFTRMSLVTPLADEAAVAGDLYIPQIVKVPDDITNPYPSDVYRIYHSTDHDAGLGGIYCLTAPAIDGPYTDRGLVYQDVVSGSQSEGPWVIWNEAESLYFLYYQQFGVSGTKASQVTCLATSANGIDNWTRVGVIMDWPGNTVDSSLGSELHHGYLRVMREANMWFGYTLWSGTSYGEYAIWWSRNGREWILDGRALHHGQHFHGDNNKRFGWNGAQALYWRGRRLLFGSFSEYTSGAANSSLGSFVSPLAQNLRAPLGNPTVVFDDTDAAAWEGGTPSTTLGSLYSEAGKIYGLYKSGTGIGLAVAE